MSAITPTTVFDRPSRLLRPTGLRLRSGLAAGIAVLFVLASAVEARSPEGGDLTATLGSELGFARDLIDEKPGGELRLGSRACVINTFGYNRNNDTVTTRTGTIDGTDCVTDDGDTRFDAWQFSGRSGDRIQIDLEGTSGNLDPFLILLDPLNDLYEQDDDSGAGLDSRIVTTLNRTGDWGIGASGLPGFDQRGNYRLSIRCLNCGPAPSQCVKGPTTLCLNDDRFRVEVDWRDFQGNTGVGSAVPGASDTSSNIWFFQPDNWELLVKVIDGCGFNNRYWVFFAATTNVEFELTVTDTVSGTQKLYDNPLGRSADAVTDTNAFATCP